MATLYELTNDYIMLMEMMEDPESDPEAIESSMESLDYLLEEKADGYAKVMAELNAKAAAIKAQEERFYSRRKAIEGNITRMKQNLQNAMQAAGKEKFKTELFSFGIQNNPPSVILETEDVTRIPGKYLIRQEPKIDKKAMLEDLKAGQELTGIAHMEQGRSLRIR